LSVLEMSRIAGIPHASVCGGRGRCSTCRVRVGGADRAKLAPPSPEEQKVLTRVGAPDNVRLACQLRPPPGRYRVTPLLPASTGPVEAYRRQPQAHGGERYVAILFADIRGFTSISEGRCPTTWCSCSTAISAPPARRCSRPAAGSTSSSATA
jgi:adenylate cyclase